jgi:cell division protein FtsB
MMFDFYEKRKLRGILFSRPVAVFLFLLALVLSWSAYGRFVAEQETRAKRLGKATELVGLKARAAIIEAKVKHLESDQGVERALREEFDVAKQGEEVIVVVDGQATSGQATDNPILPLPHEPSLFERLKFW